MDGVVSGLSPQHPLKASLILISTLVNDVKMRLLIDTGATTTFVSEQSLRHLKYYSLLHQTPSSFVLADGIAPFRTSGVVKLSIVFAGHSTNIFAHIVSKLCADIILGMDYINRYNLRIDVKHQVVSIEDNQEVFSMPMDPDQSSRIISATLDQSIYIPSNETRSIQVTLPTQTSLPLFIPDLRFEKENALLVTHQFLRFDHHSTTLTLSNISPYPQLIPEGICIGQLSYSSSSIQGSPTSSAVSPSVDATSLTGMISVSTVTGTTDHPHRALSSPYSTRSMMKPKVKQDILKLVENIQDSHEREQLLSLLCRFHDVFDTTSHNIANTPINHVITTVPHYPPACRPYPQPNTEESLYAIIQEFLAAGLIAESNSPYAAPALLVKKNDGSHRLVVDYKKLNLITIKDSSPLPNIEDVIRKLGSGYKYFSKLDLKSGFYQIPINEQDKQKTAFITPFGLFQFNVLPMGLKNSPPTFQKVMSNTLKACRSFSLVYLDDIIVFSKAFADHIHHLTQVLLALQVKNIVLNPPKCDLASQKIDYLGHVISEQRIEPSDEKISAILQIKEPTTLAQANHFLGALGWYRKFIPRFSSIAAPIHSITNLPKHLRHKFRWKTEHSNAFQQLKELLVSTPLFLHYPRPDLPLILTTDASNYGIGGVLQQEVDGELRNLYYHSQLMTPCQRRYSTIEKEALAIYKCFERMRSYLLGKSIILMTDHCPLCCIMSKSIKNVRVDRITTLIQEYDIVKVLHIQGNKNCLPDFLSRYPHPETDDLFDIDYGVASKYESSTSLPSSTPLNTSSPSIAIDSHFSPVAAMTLRSGVRSPPSTSLQRSVTKQEDNFPSSSNEFPVEDKRLSSKISRFSSNSFDPNSIAQAQDNDPVIQKTIMQLRQDPTHSSFVLRNNILHKLVQPSVRSRNKLEVIYVPSTLIPSLLSACHNDPLGGGHFSSERTYHKLKQTYWWPGMLFTIKQYIKSCISCQQYNISRHKKHGFLHPITPPPGPFQLIGIDYCGPFKMTPQGNQYVLVITDYFSRHVSAIALPNCTAQTTAITLFNEFFCKYGIPGTIISDQGVHFKNQLMINIRHLIGFNHIHSTAYHPQTNGVVERFNATFVPQISKLQDTESNNWDEYLPAVIFAYNSGIHRTTEFSPYQLLYGRTPRLPIYPPPQHFSFPKPSDYFRQLQKALKHYHQLARSNTLHQQQLMKTRYDTNRSDHHYHVGEIVLTKIHGTRGKLDPKYSPQPKTIVHAAHPNYVLRDEERRLDTKVHVGDIRPINIH